jgi:hypothetical protein
MIRISSSSSIAFGSVFGDREADSSVFISNGKTLAPPGMVGERRVAVNFLSYEN